MSDEDSAKTGRVHAVGRTLRGLVGLLLLAAVAPVLLRVGLPFIAASVVIVLGLIAVHTLLHVFLSRRSARLNPWLGAVVAVGIVIAVYVLGQPGSYLFGRGEGEIAVLLFLSVSLILAAIRADSGCEVMSIPAALLRRHTHLACLLFTPVDSLERRWHATRTS